MVWNGIWLVDGIKIDGVEMVKLFMLVVWYYFIVMVVIFVVRLFYLFKI